MKNIILFGTYWNEMEWLDASLEQIRRIDPFELIICDGCFDPAWPNNSTDGTRQVIQDFIAKRRNATMISALRLPLVRHYIEWLRPLPHENPTAAMGAKWRIAKKIHRWSRYRLNQMATFNRMVRMSKCFKPGSWFMTYDCDQFYSDQVIENFKYARADSSHSLLTAKEYTFFNDFEWYSDSHEKRDYNNMPHKIYNDTRFIPTRHPVRVVGGRYRIYSDFCKKKYVGKVFHYHIKSPERLGAGYMLGDRKPPEKPATQNRMPSGQHPRIIQQFFLR